MRIVVSTTVVAIIFLSLLATTDIYVPVAFTGALLVILLAALFGGRTIFNRKDLTLFLWFILLAHRSFIPRVSVRESEGLAAVEVSVTVFVLLIATAILLGSVHALRFRVSEARFWLLAYTVFAAASLMWTPSPIYSGFWAIRLFCVALLLMTYFADADTRDCKRFFAVTLIGSVPVLLLPIIAYFMDGTTAQSGAHRVMGSWAHPGIVSITAFSFAAGCLAALLQRSTGNGSGRYFYLAIFVAACTSGFLAAGKTGAIGGGIAVALMLLLGRRFRLWFGMVLITGLGYVLFDQVLQDLQIGLFAHWQGYNFERLQTVQGRFSLWLGALQVWSDSLSTAFFGRGFTAFRTQPIASLTGWDPGHAHSSFVNLLLDVGLVGACLFLAMLYCAVSGAVLMALRQGRAFSGSAAFPVAITLISLLVGATMDDVFGGTVQPTTYLFLGTVVALDRLAHLGRVPAEGTYPTAHLGYKQLPISGR